MASTMAAELAALFPITITSPPLLTATSPPIQLPGRAVVAARDLAAGEVVMACTAAAMEPLDVRRCSCCFAASRTDDGGSNGDASLLKCSACKTVKYCSTACQRADWQRNHKAECAAIVPLFSVSDPAAATNAVLLGRLLRGKELNTSSTPPTVVSAGPIPAVYTHTLADVLAMEADPRSSRRTEWAATVGLAKAHHLLPRETDDAQCSRIVSSFDVNNFMITNDLMDSRAAGCFPAGALLNHSCAPNCMLSYTRATPATPTAVTTKTAGAGAAGAPCVLVIRTLRAVPAGEELCHSYTEIARPREERQVHLRDMYGFTCGCPLCVAESAAGSSCDRGLTSRLDGGTLPAFLSGTFSSAAESGAAAAIPTDVSALHADALKVGRAIYKLLEMAPSEGGGVLKPATMASLGITADVAEWPYEGCRGAVSGLDAAEHTRVMEELTCAEVGIQRLQTVLAPSHLDVHASVAGALNRYIALEDHVSAVAAAARNIAFYRRAYVLTPAHPMLGLQLFTAADLGYEVVHAVSVYLANRPSKPSSSAPPPALLSKRRQARLAELYGGATLQPAPPTSGGDQGAAPAFHADWDWSAPFSAELLAWLTPWVRAAYVESGAVLAATHGAHHEFVAAARERVERLTSGKL